ncbi:immune inhibitor A, partial [bacterium]|nr:immune inhibitor A [bacterium]
MFRCLASMISLVLAAQLFAGPLDTPHHSLIRVFGKDAVHQKLLLHDHSLDLLPLDSLPGVPVAALPEDFDYLASNGYTWEVVHQDLEDFYARRAAEGGSLDLMGGFKTFAEITAEMDAIHASHPSITTARFSVGTSINGNTIWCMKISDNPEVDEDEIELMYNSLIHAREPGAMEVLFYFFNYLTDNYGSNAECTDLVNNREFYFIPCINPDGYLYNESTNPSGGGMWRKNRRLNTGGSYGVDLNRNWGFNWGYDNSGSSPTPSDETYRGTAGFSEPETNSMRLFIESRDFVVAMNYHTYSNLVLCPWGTSTYQGGYTPEHATFQVMLDSMQYLIQQVNGATYAIGPPWSLLYDVNGDCNDWCYGEQTTKDRIFPFTTEVGSSSDGFWPSPARITPLCAENLPSNLFVARYAINLVPVDYQVKRVYVSQSEQTGDGDGIVEPGETMNLAVILKNTGALSLTSISGTLSTSDADVTITSNSSSWGTLASGDSVVGVPSFAASVSAGASAPRAVNFSLHVTTTEGLDTTIAVTGVLGNPGFADNMEAGTGGWTTSGIGSLWHLSTRRSASATHSWYSGNEGTGLYDDNMNASLISQPIVIGANANLAFKHWHSLETGYDYGFVDVSDGGAWVTVAGPYTGANGVFEDESVSLAQFAPGSTIQVRFRQTSDGGVTDEGWYIDDIQIGPPPNAAAAPSFVSLNVDTNGTADAEVILSNSGGADLIYSLMFTNGSAVVDTGGPDAEGYRWQDSNALCGPAYSWLPISALGTPITFLTNEGDAVKGPYALPFSFPFYGVEYSQVYVSANGWISFTDNTNTAYINATLPSATAAATAIFAWWDDLKPQLAGTNVRYWHNGADSAAVHFENVRAGTSPQGVYNFQILLTDNGDVR